MYVFTTNLSQQSLRKLATKGIFTIDERFLDRFPWKVSRQFELGFCCFYHQSKLLNIKTNDSSGIVKKTLYNF